MLVPALFAQQNSNGQYSPEPADQQPAYGQQEYPQQSYPQPDPDEQTNGYGNQAPPQQSYPPQAYPSQSQPEAQYPSEPQYPPNAGSQYPDSQYPQPQYSAPQYPEAQQNSAPPADQEGPAQPSGTMQPLSEQQLEQLVAPIALYPDTLVAQMLAASTYPQQVAAADQWRRAQENAPADEIVAGANVQSWDPSVKALTAFPEVLSEMNRNMDWVIDLGNAYYNQPQDVLHAVQVMRGRAQSAGNLRNTPQEEVSYDQGNIVLAPPNPETVYVPQYNPWAVYGAPIAPYPGFSALATFGSLVGSEAIRFGWGVATTAFLHSPFGLLAWGLDWFAHAVLFNGSTYFSHSMTVRDWGFPHGGPRGFGRAGTFNAWNRSYGRDAYGRWRGGYSRPNESYRAETANRNYRNEMANRYRSQMANRDTYAATRPPQSFRSFQGSRENYARSSVPAFHSFGSSAMRPQYRAGSSYPGSYGQRQGSYRAGSYAGEHNSRQNSGAAYRGFQQANRSSYSSLNRGNFGNHSSKSFKGDNSSRSFGRQNFSSHFGREKAPKAPKMKSYSAKSYGGGHSGGHGHSGGGHGGKHHG